MTPSREIQPVPVTGENPMRSAAEADVHVSPAKGLVPILTGCSDLIRIPGRDERAEALAIGRAMRDLLSDRGRTCAAGDAIAAGTASLLSRMAHDHAAIVLATLRDARRAVMRIGPGDDPGSPFETVFYHASRTLGADPAIRQAYEDVRGGRIVVPEGLLDGGE